MIRDVVLVVSMILRQSVYSERLLISLIQMNYTCTPLPPPPALIAKGGFSSTAAMLRSFGEKANDRGGDGGRGNQSRS